MRRRRQNCARVPCSVSRAAIYRPICSGTNVTGFNEAWWLGLSAMHTLFAREHNVICRELRSRLPGLARRARIPDGTTDHRGADCQDPHGGMDTSDPGHHDDRSGAAAPNWYGAPKDWLTQLGIWLFDAHALKGIPRPGPIITLHLTR